MNAGVCSTPTTITAEFGTTRWPLHRPFRIARQTYTNVEAATLVLRDGAGHVGRAEALGVDYHGESASGMCVAGRQWWARHGDDDGRLRLSVDEAATLGPLGEEALRSDLPVGGLRNLLDLAAWDLRAKRSGVPAWKTAGLSDSPTMRTAFTIGIGDPREQADDLERAGRFGTLKLKCDTGDPRPTLKQLRRRAPDATWIVDANAAWTIEQLTAWSADLAALNVTLIEQPLAVGDDAALAEAPRHVPVCADESCDGLASLPGLIGLYDVVNLKLDKTGGLSEALAMADAAEAAGLRLMVGCMGGSSLAVAPAMLLAPRCGWVDLDGPLLQTADTTPGLTVSREGAIDAVPPALWG